MSDVSVSSQALSRFSSRNSEYSLKRAVSNFEDELPQHLKPKRKVKISSPRSDSYARPYKIKENTEQLLGAPKLQSGTAINQGKAIVDVLNDWELTNRIEAICFDTTSVNTGDLFVKIFYQIETSQPRNDYKELLDLSCIFLGGTPPGGIKFKAPGAAHHARWLAKAIYCLKIYMFNKQFHINQNEVLKLRKRGFIKKFQIYQGKDEEMSEKFNNYGLGERVVLELTEHEWGKDMDIGYWKWKDNKMVHFVSNFHGTEETTVSRTEKNGSKSAVTCPQTVKDYNAFMGGVDTADRLRALYCVDRKSPKWWHRLFWGVLDIALSMPLSSIICYYTKNYCKDCRRSIAQGLMSQKDAVSDKRRVWALAAHRLRIFTMRRSIVGVIFKMRRKCYPDFYFDSPVPSLDPENEKLWPNALDIYFSSFYDVIKRPLNDRDISRLLIGEEDDSTQEELSNSHSEDGLEVDDAESDNQEETSDHEDRSSVILLDEASGSQSLSVPLEESSERSRTSHILSFSQNTIRSRSRHVWTTSKGQASSRTGNINIVRVARGPARAVKNMVDPLILLDNFLTDEIQEQIVKWTNAEIAIKRQTYNQITSTQK
ncbi:PiggyBac transposable element-derived protein 4 [Eumeta japonica]|uniref:PiggyBac transposable element-derived protein 4 n=1 Tax=Eumeta variegata TaxID=151549 RepID=A0A4C1ZED0_EUMVA|nr:PiggyBac transposable element-derived protein 4 [Eumeta japonica]